jgi:hypothetical protein
MTKILCISLCLSLALTLPLDLVVSSWTVVEPILGYVGIIIGVPAAWWVVLPRYTAVCLHDGGMWLDAPGVWSACRGVAGDDLEAFVKAWTGKVLTGRFVTDAQARLPVNPVPRRYRVRLTGARRGVYYVVGVRVLCPDLLSKFGRCAVAPVDFEEADEEIAL